MTTKRIVWLRPDGGVSITTPIESPLDGEVEQYYLDRLALAFLFAHPDHADYKRMPDMDASALPSDRAFRDAWTHDGKGITYDMAKARTIYQKRLIAQRDAIKLNVAVAAFLGDAAAKKNLQALMALDQALPDQLAAITDLAELVTFIPAALVNVIVTESKG